MSGEEKKYDLIASEQRAIVLKDEKSVFFNPAKFEQTCRVATMLSKSTFVPEWCRGPGGVGDCVIALDMAERLGMNPIMLMQTMYVIHGRPAFEGRFMSALVNISGRYSGPLEYEWAGSKSKNGNHAGWGCRAYATRKATGNVVHGPWVTWEIVVAEGWNQNKKGVASKWTTMPELMFMYRAASFFVKTNDSDLMLGMQTKEELEDVQEMQVGNAGVYHACDCKKGKKDKAMYENINTPGDITEDAPQAEEPVGESAGAESPFEE